MISFAELSFRSGLKMPIEYDIIEALKLVVAKGSGVLTGRDIIDHLNSLSNDVRYIAPMKKFIDYQDVEDMAVTTDEAWQIADKKKSLNAKFHGERCAFVAPKDITYGASRVHQALIDGADLNTEVFRSTDEALSWLDVPLDAVR